MNDAFRKLDSCNKPVLLLLDEVQHLATDSSFTNFTSALRSFMVNRPDQHIKGIFTGSSQVGLSRLFHETKAPFFDSAETLPFKALGLDFVKFELVVYKQVTGGQIIEPALGFDIFKKQNLAPGRFVGLLKKMVLNQQYDINKAYELFGEVLEEADNQEHRRLIGDLKTFDLGLLKLIATNQATGLYTQDGKERIGELVNSDVNINRSAISNALNRLRDKNLVFREKKGNYQIDDPSFRNYILDHKIVPK